MNLDKVTPRQNKVSQNLDFLDSSTWFLHFYDIHLPFSKCYLQNDELGLGQ